MFKVDETHNHKQHVTVHDVSFLVIVLTLLILYSDSQGLSQSDNQ